MPTTSTRERPLGRTCSRCGAQIEVTVNELYVGNYQRGAVPYKTWESEKSCIAGCVGEIE